MYDNKIKISVEVFAHYPEALISVSINDKLNGFFKKYFYDNYDLSIEIDSFVLIKSLPHSEDQSVIVSFEFSDYFDFVDVDKLINDWKGYLNLYFNNQFRNIEIRINK